MLRPRGNRRKQPIVFLARSWHWFVLAPARQHPHARDSRPCSVFAFAFADPLPKLGCIVGRSQQSPRRHCLHAPSSVQQQPAASQGRAGAVGDQAKETRPAKKGDDDGEEDGEGDGEDDEGDDEVDDPADSGDTSGAPDGGAVEAKEVRQATHAR